MTDKRGGKQISFIIPDDIYKEFQRECNNRKCNMKDIIFTALLKELGYKYIPAKIIKKKQN